MKIAIPSPLKKMGEIFGKNGFSSYLVGGAVRDVIMKKTPHDFDVATDALPQDVIRIFYKVIPTGIEHGTVTVHFMKNQIEVTTFRAESGYTDSRHPDKVSFGVSLEDDLSRRDFTMNAIAASLKTGEISDPFSGIQDIKNKTVRTVGNAKSRFSEDALRPIRAVRFATTLNFSIEKETKQALFDKEIKNKIKSVSIERFRDEFVKLLGAEKPSSGLEILYESGILEIFIPEFLPCDGCTQGDERGFHDFDVLHHLFYACDSSPREKLNVRLASLFHDIGKPQSKGEKSLPPLQTYGFPLPLSAGENAVPPQRPPATLFTFYNHEQISEKITREILTRLRFPNVLIENVCHLVKNHMFHYESVWKNSAVRRFIAKVGYENIDDLFDLRLSDMGGMHNKPVRLHDSPAVKLLLELKERIENEKAKKSCICLKTLAINGRDLIAIGIKEGKEIGKTLNYLLETVLDDPAQNEKERLLEIAKNLRKC